MTEQYLVHHGILGQKWGVRRYQNPDGTLTAEGRLRYRQDSKTGKYVKLTSSERKAAVAKQKAEAEKRNKSPRNKKINELTDKQLEKYINRLSNEKRAIELRNDVNRLDPKPVSAGEQFAKRLLKETIEPAVINIGKQYLEKMAKEALNLNEKAVETKEQKAQKEAQYWKNLSNIENSKADYNKTKALNDTYEKDKDPSIYNTNKKKKG